MMKNNYLVESLAPLVFRSAKPFGAQASAQDAIFPLPSTAAGMIRALAISQGKLTLSEQRLTNIEHEAYQKVLALQVKGPFLVRFENENKITILVPKPTNAMYFEDRKTQDVKLIRLSPQAFNTQECGSDLPEALLPVQMTETIKGKPKAGVNFWTLEHVQQWQQDKDLKFEDVQHDGLTNLPIEIRTHVAIDSDTFASQTGKLFQTANIDLSAQKLEKGGWQDHRLGFLIQSDIELKQEHVVLGGERRLSICSPVHTALYQNTELSLDALNKARGFSLNLLSPAIFAKGYLPQWLDQSLEGTLPNTDIRLRLKATAIDRWLPVSGWDSLLWKPKAMRKA